MDEARCSKVEIDVVQKSVRKLRVRLYLDTFSSLDAIFGDPHDVRPTSGQAQGREGAPKTESAKAASETATKQR